MRITRRRLGLGRLGLGRLGVGIGLAGLVVASIAIVAPAAIAKKPGATGASGGGKTSLRRLQGVNFVGSCRFSHEAPDDPIVFFQKAGSVPRPYVRGQHDNERVLDGRLAAERLDHLQEAR